MIFTIKENTTEHNIPLREIVDLQRIEQPQIKGDYIYLIILRDGQKFEIGQEDYLKLQARL